MNIDEKNSVIQFMHKATDLIKRMGDDYFVAMSLYMDDASRTVLESMSTKDIEKLEEF